MCIVVAGENIFQLSHRELSIAIQIECLERRLNYFFVQFRLVIDGRLKEFSELYFSIFVLVDRIEEVFCVILTAHLEELEAPSAIQPIRQLLPRQTAVPILVQFLE